MEHKTLPCTTLIFVPNVYNDLYRLSDNIRCTQSLALVPMLSICSQFRKLTVTKVHTDLYCLTCPPKMYTKRGPVLSPIFPAYTLTCTLYSLPMFLMNTLTCTASQALYTLTCTVSLTRLPASPPHSWYNRWARWDRTGDQSLEQEQDTCCHCVQEEQELISAKVCINK
jgi:hypothetical protein